MYVLDLGGDISGTYYVMVDGSGKLRKYSSSRRYKENIQDMPDVEDQVMSMRPVTFNMKNDPTVPKRTVHGLIAEELDQVMPELVVYDKEGRPDAVSYLNLTAILLKQVQKQHTCIVEQQETIQQQQMAINELQKLPATIAELEARLALCEANNMRNKRD